MIFLAVHRVVIMKKILVVDDDDNIRELYVFLFEKTGIYQVDSAKDGQEAYEKIEEFNPDLILLDVMMPKFDGLHVLKTVRQSNPNVIVILNTAYSDVKRDFNSWTAHAIVEKTMLPSDVLDTVSRLFAEADKENSTST